MPDVLIDAPHRLAVLLRVGHKQKLIQNDDLKASQYVRAGFSMIQSRDSAIFRSSALRVSSAVASALSRQAARTAWQAG